MPNLIIQPTVPTLYKKILKDHVSGELFINGNGFQKKLFFQGGNLVFASTTLPGERLGQVLYNSGKISEEQLQQFPSVIKSTKGKIGKILVEMNVISQRDLFEALKDQIKLIAVSLFQVENGEWDFVKQTPDVPEDSRFKIRLPEIIVAGFEQLKGIPFFENQFFYQVPKTGIIPQGISKCLSQRQITFYRELSTFSDLSSDKIIGAMGIPEKRFWEKMNLFYVLGILDFDEDPGTLGDTMITMDAGLAENIQDMIMFFEELKEGRLNKYQVLGLSEGASIEEINDAYQKQAKRYDLSKTRLTGELAQKAQFVQAALKNTLDSLTTALQPLGIEQPFPDLNEEEASRAPDDNKDQARTFFARGEELFKEKKFMEAALIIEKAVEIEDGEASYFLMLGEAQAEIPLLRPKAEGNLRRAVEMDPQNPEPLYALGLLFRSGDQPQKAEVFFRKALELDVDNSLAGKIPIPGIEESSRKKSVFSLFGKKK